MTTWTQWLTTTLSGLATLATFGAGCLTTQGGCVSDDVRRAFGYTQPDQGGSVVVDLGWGRKRIIIGSDFEGHVTGSYNPETGAFDVDATISSNASAIYDAQGRRINDNFVASRNLEWQGKAAAIAEWGRAIQAALLAGGDAASKVVTAGLPLFAGSTVDFTGPAGAAGSATLGTPLPAPPIPTPGGDGN